MTSRQTLGLHTAAALVIANMVGTGVFTSLGFQVQAVPSAFCALSLWALGGVVAACGALVYAELACAMPRSGGEYAYLTELYHPAVGFLSGWVSGTVAFAAPLALSAMAFDRYMNGVFPAAPEKLLGGAALVGVSAVHLWSRDKGARFLNASTALKLLPIAALIFLGVFHAAPAATSFAPARGDLARLFSPGFAVSLVYVSYAYSGWNASIYLAGDVRDPARNVPRSILWGVGAVTTLYLLLNGVFLKVVPLDKLVGTIEVGNLVGERLWGPTGRALVGATIGLGLVSSLSSFVLAGSRLLESMGRDYPRAGFLSRVNAQGNPSVAILSQTLIALALFAFSQFDRVMTFIGFTLTVFTVLAVFGLFRLRRRGNRGAYRTPGYPWTPALFLAFNLWMMFFLLKEHGAESLAGLGVLAVGFGVYRALTRPAAETPAALPAPGAAANNN